MICPKCGSSMSCGAPHADGDVAQWECHNCGYIERVPARQEAE